VLSFPVWNYGYPAILNELKNATAIYHFPDLFGGPRYYDQQLFTTAAGACSYDKVGPDANALNKINDHHCGK